jgi:hypothetical protein
MIKINNIVFIILIIILININFVNNDKKFKINLLVENNINKILLSICILFLVIEDVKLGVLSFLLFFILLQQKDKNIEKFVNYYKKNNI